MNIHPEQLEVIYQQLAEKLCSNEVVKYFAQTYPLATAFSYRTRDDGQPKMRYYVKSREWSFPIESLHTVSQSQQFLDKVLEDAENLIKLANRDDKILEFYLTKIRSL